MLGLFALVGAVLVAINSAYSEPPDFKWTMINVNHTKLQSDAHLIQVRNGATLLIDAGFLDPARERLVPYLRENGIDKLDYVFISHPHRDHYGGIAAVLDAKIAIGEIFFNMPQKSVCDREIPWGCKYQHVQGYHDMLREYGVVIKTASPGLKLDLGNGATLAVLYAFDGINTPVGATDVNDLSLIIMLEYAGFKFLFPGDLNQAIGGYLAEHADEISADFLKVPHHGTESVAPNSFFRKVNAKYGLVPAPAGLWCSSRSARIRSWFAKNKTPVFVNGHSGNVSVEVRGDNFKIVAENDTPLRCE